MFYEKPKDGVPFRMGCSKRKLCCLRKIVTPCQNEVFQGETILFLLTKCGVLNKLEN